MSLESNQQERNRLLRYKCECLGFADLAALKYFKNNEITEMTRLSDNEQDKLALFEELANFNSVIDHVISKKLIDFDSF